MNPTWNGRLRGERRPDTVASYMKSLAWLKPRSPEWHNIRCAFAAGVVAGVAGMHQLFRKIEWEQEWKRTRGKKKGKKVRR